MPLLNYPHVRYSVTLSRYHDDQYSKHQLETILQIYESVENANKTSIMETLTVITDRYKTKSKPLQKLEPRQLIKSYLVRK
jgi:hypothetical protein